MRRFFKVLLGVLMVLGMIFGVVQESCAQSPDILVSPVKYTFGMVAVGGSSLPGIFTITNTGSGDLNVGAITIAGADFTIQNNNCQGQTLAQNQTCTFEVVFSPVSIGIKTATLTILSNDPDSPSFAVPLSGVGFSQTGGTPLAWGHNGSGQLGNGSNTDSNIPVTVSGISNAVAIAGGGYHTAALLSDGTLRTWGYNGSGQLGNGSNTDSNIPVTVSGISNAVAIAGGDYHTAAIASAAAGPDLTLTKSSDPFGDTDCTQQVFKGDTIAYTLSYENVGDTDATNVTLIDYLDSGVDLVDTGGGTLNGSTLTWDLETIPANQANSRTFTVKITADSGTCIANYAQISADNSDTITSDTITHKVKEHTVGFKLNKSSEPWGGTDCSQTDSIYKGDTITYSLHYECWGETGAANTKVVDHLDPGLTYLHPVGASAGAYDTPTHTLTWNLNQLNNGDTGDLIFVAQVTADSGVCIVNYAKIWADNNDTVTSDTVTHKVKELLPGLNLYKNSEPYGDTDCTQIVHKGDTIIYTLQYDNYNGDAEAVNAVLTDYLDPGVTVVDTGGAVYDSSTHTLTWSLGTIPAYGVTDFKNFSARVTADSGVCIVNYASISADNNDTLYSDTVAHRVKEITVNAGPDDTICSGTCTVLNGSATGGSPPYIYVWTPTIGLDRPDSPNPTACPDTTTTYTLTVTDANGCTG
ncbi:choice-of-anchor D domain-containing protein, partial [bacterium]|nr:choice-of-anchor D domain-containing protein [bacterium]